MRIHASSASAAITRTLEEIIAISGHSAASASDAELILVDQFHPAKNTPPGPRIVIGGKTAGEENVVAPLSPNQLIRLLRSRTGGMQSLSLGNGWQLDQTARTLLHGSGARASLTEKECALLTSLADAHPEPMKHDALLAEVWGMRHEIDTHTLETHIYRLRSKLDGLKPRPCDILTVGGAYKLDIA